MGIIDKNLKYTIAAFNKIKSELLKLRDIFSKISLAFFICYYAYLIYQHYTSIPHLVAYIIMFLCVVSAYLIKQIYKAREAKSHKDEKIDKEQKKKHMFAVDIIKYLAKGLTVVLALSSIMKNHDSDILFVSTIVSVVIYGVQVLFEVVGTILEKYIEYIIVGFNMDMENGQITKHFQSKEERQLIKSEKELCEAKNESFYTEKENEIRHLLADEVNAKKDEKENTKKEIKQKTKENRKQLAQVKKINKAQVKQAKAEEKQKRKTEKHKENETQNFVDLDNPETAEN